MRNILLLSLLVSGLSGCCKTTDSIFIEAESIGNKGGWVLDNQSTEVMGSPYLMAHGLGEAVEDATGSFTSPNTGDYHLWVRTRDWTKQWHETAAAGKFNLAVNNSTLPTIFGTNGGDWSWQAGGIISLKEGVNTIALEDITGFNGRIDAVYFTTDHDDVPPNQGSELKEFRRQKLNIANKPTDGGEYDLVVIGGGIGGCATAIAAARKGLSVALIHNRSVLGGNNSSEVRVGLSGLISQQPYINLGNIMDELGGIGYWNNVEAKANTTSERSKQILAVLKTNPEKLEHNAGVASNYEDDKKLNLIKKHDNITLFINTNIDGVVMDNDNIVSVLGSHIESSEEFAFSGDLFVDCTGDGTVGALAGADYMIGRESKAQTGEESAPEVADSLTMGASVQWYSEDESTPSTFASTPWAINFTEETCHFISRGDWDWEAGMMQNQITEMEAIRDHALRAVFGNWDYIKNKSQKSNKYSNKKLAWVAYIGGKRESRRLIGDIVLTEQDIMDQKVYDDASFTTTWGMDLHYPVKSFTGEDPYRSYADIKEHKPYAVPYRTLYSRNISNLFMVGRNVSVTHVALGTVRVMRTIGMMGEVVGLAASICVENNTTPRGVYSEHLPELKKLMTEGIGVLGF